MASDSNIETALSSPSSSSSKHPWKYEVFLSFRGEDTRNTFTCHLYDALEDKGIQTFKDDEKLDIGKPISRELLDTIEKSRIAVIILSRNYASSTWCLEELAKIVECMKERRMRVLPIFYHVDPSDVRNQRGTFADAFAKHDERFEENRDKVQTWRDALKEVANLSGRHLKDEPESKFIQDVVKMISTKWRDTLPRIDEDNLVGIDSRVKELYSHLDVASKDVRFIGICGMSGMGKTTLARVVFQKCHNLFRARSFLENISVVSKKNGLVALQENLLSDMKLKSDNDRWDVLEGIEVIRNRLRYKKVLIVLDDVDEREQLETLAGKCDWFGPGSRIIVTTTDRQLLAIHGVEKVYMIKGLNKYDGELDLQLFCREAFHRPHCENEFLDLCKDFVRYAGGHPLALKILGSSLLGKGKKVWESARDELKAIPKGDINKKLKIGFDGLGDAERKVFLDIACFFNGEDKDRVVDILKGSDCFPEKNIETLVDKSLITIAEKKLWIHNLLQRMGWEIVRCEYPQMPGNRSRLWCCDDILQVLRDNSGTYKVEGIMLNSAPYQEEHLNAEAFSNMNNLRLIKICNVNLPRGLNYLSNRLRLMEWHEFPLGSMPRSFQPGNLVELIMHRSRFEQLPTGFCNLNKLKLIDLSESQKLIMTPDFSGFPNLQRLNFQACSRLYEVHPSIGTLNQLIQLNLKDCRCLNILPDEINLESLEVFILSGCSSLKKFPEIGKNMKHLSELYLDGTAIEVLPLSVQHLTGLILLHLRDCKKLLRFPTIICGLPVLRTLILSGCKGQPLASDILFSIGVTFTLLLPNSFSGLTSLVALDLSDCNLLDGALPDDLSGLSSLESLNLSRNNFTRLPVSISGLSKLKFIYLDNCSRLQILPNLPTSTQFVMARECTSLENYSNQVIVWTSGEEGIFTVINCLSLADNEESKVSEISLLDLHFQPSWMEEQIHQSEGYHGIPQTAIPEWFNQKHGSSISISLPYDLSKNGCWRGIVFYTVLRTNFGVNNRADDSNNLHELTCVLDVDGGLSNSTIDFKARKDQYYNGSFGLCLYISHARFRHHLDQRNCITASFTTNSPGVVIQGCGARILYEQDMVQFVQILTQKNFGWIPLLLVQKLGRSDPHDQFYGTGPLDFHPSNRYSFCFPPSKIEEWFSHHSRGHAVAIDIPPRLYNDKNWLGLVLYASFSIHQGPETELDNLVSEISHFLYCQFQMRTLHGLDDEILSCHTSRQEIMQFITRGGFIWISYIPGEKLEEMLLIGGKWQGNTLHQCSHIATSFISDCPSMKLEKCALRLLYQHDQTQFEQELRHCNDLISEYWDSISQSMADQEKTNDAKLVDEVGLGGTVHSRKALEIEIFRGPIDQCLFNNWRDYFLWRGYYNFCCPPNKNQNLFNHQSRGHSLTINIPPNLCNDKKWMGLALCASFSLGEDPGTILNNLASDISHSLYCRFGTSVAGIDDQILTCYTSKEEIMWLIDLGGFIWISYIGGEQFENMLHRCSRIEASFESDWPGVTVDKCAFHFLCWDDLEQFEQELGHCNDLISKYRDSLGQFMADQKKRNERKVDDEVGLARTVHFYKDLEIEIFIRPILRQAETTGSRSENDLLDSVYNECYPPSKILEWFSHRSEEPRATIPLPPNLYNESTWMGLALCASFSVLEHWTTIANNPDAQVPCNLFCDLETDIGSVERFHIYCLTKDDLKLLRLDGFIWLSYIPRGSFPDFLNKCGWIEASIATDYPGLTVQKCGFRLLYQDDKVEFDEIKYHYWASYQTRPDVMDKLYPESDKDEADYSTTSSSYNED